MFLSFSILFIWNHLTNYHFWDNKKTISAPQISFWQEWIRRMMVKALNLIYTVILSNRAQDSILFHENRVYKAKANKFYPILLISPWSSPRDAHLFVLPLLPLYTKCSLLYLMHQFWLHVINKDVNVIEEEDIVEWKKEIRRGERGDS